MSFHRNTTVKMSLAVVLAAAVAGCQTKKQPFADVPARDREEMAPLVTGPIEPGVASVVAPAGAPAVVAAPAVAATQPVAVRQPVAPVDIMAGLELAAKKHILRPAYATLQTPAEMTLSIGEGGVLRRAWPRTVAYMPSGDTLAYPHYWNTTDTAMYRSNWANAVLEPAEFWVNMIILPVHMLLVPPWTPVVYSDEGPAAEEHPVIGQPWLEQGR